MEFTISLQQPDGSYVQQGTQSWQDVSTAQSGVNALAVQYGCAVTASYASGAADTSVLYSEEVQ
jgi:hypothetical protein